MHKIDLQQAADYLEAATIEQTIEAEHTIIHTGRNAAGVRFVIINDCFGNTVVSEAL